MSLDPVVAPTTKPSFATDARTGGGVIGASAPAVGPAARAPLIDPARIAAAVRGEVVPPAAPVVQSAPSSSPSSPSASTLIRQLPPVVRRAAAAAALVVVAVLALRTLPDADRLTREEERALTDAWLQEAALRLGPVVTAPDDVVNVMVGRVTTTIATALQARLQGRNVRVFVVDNATLAQVVTLPDGSIAVTTALLRKLASEAELGWVVAHALAHVVNGDVAASIAPQQRALREALAPVAPATVALLLPSLLAEPFAPEDEANADAVARDAVRAAGWDGRAASLAIEHVLHAPSSSFAAQHQLTLGRASAIAGAGAGRTGEDGYATKVMPHPAPTRPTRPTSDEASSDAASPQAAPPQAAPPSTTSPTPPAAP